MQLLQQIKKSTQYYLTVVISLALTLSILFSVFSLFDAVYLKPLPYKDIEQLYWQEGTITYQGQVMGQTNTQAQRHVQENSRAVSQMAIYFPWTEYKLFDFPARPDVPVYMASHNFFDTLGVKPRLGRLFNEMESTGNRQPSLVMSEFVWQSHFNGDPQIIGKAVQLNNRSFNVVGVVSSDMALPNRSDVAEAIWIPLDMDESMDPLVFNGFGGDIKGVLRLAEGVELQQAQKEIAELYEQGARLYLPDYMMNYSPSARIVPIEKAIQGDSAGLILMLIAGAGLLTIIAMVNLGDLQIARAVSRVQQLAICYAFGATRKQIFLQLFKHNFYLVATSCFMGLMLAWGALDFIASVAADIIPRTEHLSISVNMLLLAALVVILISVIFNAIELQAVDEASLQQTLQSSGKGTGKQLKKSTSHFLIGLQVCFSVITLVATSQVLYLTLVEALRSNHLVTDNVWEVVVSFADISDKTERVNVYRGVKDILESEDYVQRVSYASEKRMPRSLNFNSVYNENKEQLASSKQLYVDDGYFELFNIYVQGQAFNSQMTQSDSPEVIINQRLEERIPGNAVGQKIMVGNAGPYSIIGVASNTDYPGQSQHEVPELYFPSTYTGSRTTTLVIKTTANFTGFKESELLAMMLQVEPRLSIKQLSSVTDDFSNAAKNQVFGAVLAGVIALVSLIMVVAGIAGMVSYMLAIRRYDMGVKMAMGATNEVLFMEQLKSLALPIGMAMLFSTSLLIFFLGYSRTVPEWLFEIHWSKGVYTLLIIAFIAGLSCVLPTLKVLRTNPISALRNQ